MSNILYLISKKNMREIQLTQGKVALVDDEDFEYFNQWKWHAIKSGNTFYAYRNQKINDRYEQIKMHRLILGITDSIVLADHRDLNGLNNQKYNLRIATKAQNNANRRAAKNGVSKYLGVNWLPDRKKWKAEIRKDGKNKHLGRFKNEIDAAMAYNKAAMEVHGEFAHLNNIAI